MRSPCFDPGDIRRAAEVVLVLGSGEPTSLASGFARCATARGCAITLVITITRIRAKKFVAALALTTFPTGHRVPLLRGLMISQRRDHWGLEIRSTLGRATLARLRSQIAVSARAQSADSNRCFWSKIKPVLTFSQVPKRQRPRPVVQGANGRWPPHHPQDHDCGAGSQAAHRAVAPRHHWRGAGGRHLAPGRRVSEANANQEEETRTTGSEVAATRVATWSLRTAV